MADWNRDTALLTMTSALGPDALLPISLTASESISETFEFEVYAVSQHGIIDPDTLLWQPACVTLQSNGEPVRYFHGIVRIVTAEGALRGADAADDHQLYRLIMVPRLWFLNQTVDCRVFQNLTVVDVLKQLFQDVGLTGTTFPPPGGQREYIVQFNETDMHFATRLMEEEGYFYFFQHTASAHTLIIANQNGAFIDVPDGKLHQGGGESDATLLADFDRSVRTVRGQMKFKDYDPEKPDTLLQNQQPTTLKAGGAPTRDDFRWPALAFDNGTVTDRTKREMEAAEAVASLYEGSCRFGGLFAGGKFTIASKPAGPYDGAYVLQSVVHRASDETWLNREATSGYTNRFTAFQSSLPWRQPMTTMRPRMDGVHTALVLGPQHGKDAEIKSQDGEEIHTDDMARVKVRFFWDHRAEATGDASCWARVIQPWAGNGWGAQFIPRVGTEVAIAFVDGDPDRPIVLGGLYNGRDKPIYSKDDKTKSGFRSRSSLKGGASEFNEFTFDDKKGNELIYMQAQKDLTTYVKHDETLKIDNCRIVTVKKDETITIKGDQSVTIDGSQTSTIGSGRTTTINKGGDSLTVKMGDYAIAVKQGAMTCEAMTSIELKVGSNSLKIDQTGVSIAGTMVKVAGQAMLDMKAPMSTLKGDGMLTLKGGIVMVN